MRSLQPTGDLLGRPIQPELSRYGLSQARIIRQFTTFRTTSSVPGRLISRRRSVSIRTAIPPKADIAKF